jgi:hypothetical protein
MLGGPPTRSAKRPALSWQVWLAILPLATGAGLVTYLLAGLSLPIGVTLAGAVGLAATVAVWRRTPVEDRPAIRRRAFVGLAAGGLATLAYDLCRLVTVTLSGLRFRPFDVFPIFGRLLIGRGAPETPATLIGVLFHAANGIGFAIAYMFLFRRVGIVSGLLWAALLEGMMISLYPSWLNVKALDELVSVSILGHVAYGCVLGGVARRGVLGRWPFRSPALPAPPSAGT